MKTAQPKKVIEELNFYVEHIVKTRERGMPMDGAVQTVVYSYPALKTLNGISIDNYGKATVKYPPGGAIVNVKYRR